MRTQIAAANWKMNCTLEQANDLLDQLVKENISLSPGREVVIAVPFPYLILGKRKIKKPTWLQGSSSKLLLTIFRGFYRRSKCGYACINKS